MKVILVRHAMPEVEPGAPPEQWVLGSQGRAAAAALRDRLPERAVWCSSPEPKAYETLRLAAPQASIVRHPDLGEVRRDEPYEGDFQARRSAWVAGALDRRHRGWETPTDAAARFAGALSELAPYDDRPLVIATHGMVLTVWLVHAARALPVDRAAGFWAVLRCPDVLRVQLPENDARPPTIER